MSENGSVSEADRSLLKAMERKEETEQQKREREEEFQKEHPSATPLAKFDRVWNTDWGK